MGVDVDHLSRFVVFHRTEGPGTREAAVLRRIASGRAIKTSRIALVKRYGMP
jgi:hypothetical protein